MTRSRLPRRPAVHSPKPLIDLRVLVLLAIAGAIGWLAVVRPAVAAAVGLGLSSLYLLHRMVGR